MNSDLKEKFRELIKNRKVKLISDEYIEFDGSKNISGCCPISLYVLSLNDETLNSYIEHYGNLIDNLDGNDTDEYHDEINEYEQKINSRIEELANQYFPESFVQGFVWAFDVDVSHIIKEEIIGMSDEYIEGHNMALDLKKEFKKDITTAH